MTDAQVTEKLLPCPACGSVLPPRHWNVGNSKACPSRACNLIGPMGDPDGSKWNALPRRNPIEAAFIERATEARVRAELAADVAKARVLDVLVERHAACSAQGGCIEREFIAGRLVEERAKLGLP